MVTLMSASKHESVRIMNMTGLSEITVIPRRYVKNGSETSDVTREGLS